MLGDCEGCHGKDLAGGVALETPFGKLVAPNITPDKETGIGNYSAEDFRQAMKAGIAPGGKRLYPAMPYPVLCPHDAIADIAALWDYLQTVKPVKNSVDVNQLRFPYNLRFMMRGWNILFFSPAPYADDCRQERGLESRRLSGERARPLRRLPYAQECLRRRQGHGADRRLAARLVRAGPDRRHAMRAWARGAPHDIVEYLGTGRNAIPSPPARWRKRWKIPPPR